VNGKTFERGSGDHRPNGGGGAMTRRRSWISGLSDARRGIVWMLGCILVATTMDTIAKYLAQTYPVPQITWARTAFQAIVVIAVFAPRLSAVARTRRLGLQLVRSGLLLGANLSFVYGLRAIPLVEASAILFLAPLIVTALAKPLLGEPVGVRRWAAVVVGFVGAVIIIRPGGGVMQAAAIFPLTTAVLYALYMIATRHLSRDDSAVTTLFYTALVGALVMSVPAPLFWQTPDFAGWTLMILLGVLGGVCHFALIRAFEAAPAATITPFEYSRLIWATLLGFAAFGNLPDGWTVLGAAIIVGAGVYVYRRESAAADSTDAGKEAG